MQEAAHKLSTVRLGQRVSDDKHGWYRNGAQADLDKGTHATLVGGAERCTRLENDKCDRDRSEHLVVSHCASVAHKEAALRHGVDAAPTGELIVCESHQIALLSDGSAAITVNCGTEECGKLLRFFEDGDYLEVVAAAGL